MARLAIRVLGPFEVALDGEPVTRFETRKARALLAYLAAGGDHPHRREALAEMLWPGRPQGAARANLRHTLRCLRLAIADYDASPAFLLASRETLQLNPEGDASVDIDTFAELLAGEQGGGHPDILRLEAAVRLYRGVFLEDLSLPDSATFEEWLILKREQIGRQVVTALHRLTEGYEQLGEYERAMEHAWQRVELEPWDEAAQRQVMRLLAVTDHRDAALARYEDCRRVIDRELGVEPEKETIALYERIRDGLDLLPAPPTPRHNLPAPLTPFVGRKEELADIQDRLLDPACRLLTLVGPGGIGKTRLATEAGRVLVRQAPGGIPDGAFLIPLAPLQSSEAMVAGIGQALHLPPSGETEPQEQLLNYLRRKRLLLVLDGCEHMHDAAGLTLQILRAAPGIKILATSQVRLNVKGESLLPVAGLKFPDTPHDTPAPPPAGVTPFAREASRYSAVQLFLLAAQRASPSFEPKGDDLRAIAHTCRLVGGMPLAVLLAAAWVGMLSPTEIAVQIESSFDFLEADWCDLPERQRSIRTVFDHSWRLLTQREQEVLQGLSVFRGCFRRDAAQQVAGASLHELRALADRSLLYRTATGEYQVHELVRQYAADHLRRAGQCAGEAVRERYIAYYAAAAEHWATELKGPRQRAALAEMDAEGKELRTAWEWAIERGRVEQLDQMMEGLQALYWRRGRYREGEAAFRRAAARLAEESHVRAHLRSRVVSRVLAWQSSYCQALGHRTLAARLQNEVLSSLEVQESRDQDTRCEKALLYWLMGRRVHVSDYSQARLWYEKSLSLYRQCQDRWGTANVLHAVGSIARLTGAMSEARSLCEESLAIRRVLGDRTGIAKATISLAEIALHEGWYEESERLAQEGIAECQRLGDQAERAYGLHILGTAQEMGGKFAEALPIHEQSLSVFLDLGRRHYLAAAQSHLASTNMHLGRYQEAQDHAVACLLLARETDLPFKIAQAQRLLGALALTRGAYAECRRQAQESLAVSEQTGHGVDLGLAHVILSHAARGLGDLDGARRHLSAALPWILESGANMEFLWVLSAAVLVLADQGENERAVEVHGLLSQHGHVAHSRWFADIVVRPMTAAVAALPPDIVAGAEERGRARDLDATAAELLAELGSHRDHDTCTATPSP
jgi:predicted ATPase/DNA-binding SARP family transcriptional activator